VIKTFPVIKESRSIKQFVHNARRPVSRSERGDAEPNLP
jgi:hypothetical protein